MLLHFQEMELSGFSIKKFLTFSQKKSFLIFQETELFYISGNNFQSSENKKNQLLIGRNNNKIDSIESWC